MYLGHGAYGVEAASRLYFHKSNKQLTLEEAALIAGIFQTPERQSPFVDMKRATARRNVVLQRMADERYITQAQADAAKAKPIVTRGQPNQPPGIAPFFVEEVRKHLEQQYGAKVLYENGLVGADDARREAAGPGEQRARARAARLRQAARLAETDAQRRRREAHHRGLQGRTLDAPDRASATSCRRWSSPRRRPAPARLRIGAHARGSRQARLRLDAQDVGRPICSSRAISSTSRSPSSIAATGAATVTLEQTPLAEGAMLAIDNHTGQIKAMVGGWSFSRSKFNRAVQAYRQLGSTFKPIVYTAAIDRGYTPSSIIVDAPVSYQRRRRPAALQPAQLRPQVPRTGDAALRARGVAQHSRRSR